MITLGPMDADLNGAPSYWRDGNWRPHTLTRGGAGCAYSTVPFDKCDLVLEYDARNEKAPRPEDQGWKHGGSVGDPAMWKHDPARGTLAFEIKEGESFWTANREVETMPPRAVAYSLFLVDQGSESDKISGLDFVVQASPEEGRARGMRASWSDRFLYRALSGPVTFPVLEPAAEPTLTRVWHRMALDAELRGPNVNVDDSDDVDTIDKDDGGKTIGSLDDRVNNDDRRRFGYGARKPLLAQALFGKTDKRGPLVGRLRNFVASYPGRFMRAGFRAAALGKRTRLRFVFCLDSGEKFEPGAAAFLVRYASPSIGLRPGALPLKEADPSTAVRQFDAADLHRTVEVAVDLEGLETGEELWFTIERDWRHKGDQQRATAHLLMVIVEKAGG